MSPCIFLCVFYIENFILAVVLDDASSTPPSLRVHQQQQSSNVAFAGDHVLLTVTGLFEPDSIYPGHLLCRGGTSVIYL